MVLNLANLNGDNGFRIDGVAAYDYSGVAVVVAGDVNGDGIDDLVIGAPGVNEGAGAAYVVFGRAEGVTASLSLSALDGRNGFRLTGVFRSDNLGTSVAAAGDVNGDGIDDLLVSADRAGARGPDNTGQTFVVFGSTDGFAASLSVSALNGSNGFRIDGAARGDFSGFDVAGVGDVNGDGFDDIMISALGATNAAFDQIGRVFVVFGSDQGFGASLSLGALNGANGFRIDGIADGDVIGRSVSGAGDLNGDGIADLVIGAPYATPNGVYEAGEAYVIFGRRTGFAAVLPLADLNGDNGFILQGIAENDAAGRAVASAGDINGDGIDDLLVGAPDGGKVGFIGNGEAYVVFGRTDGFDPTLALASLNGTNGFRLTGTDPVGLLGFSLAAAGDVNGDGFDDILVGSYRADPGRVADAGKSFVVFGRAGGFGATLSLATLAATAGFQIDGFGTRSNSGYSVSGAGDLNGDGIDDLLIGARSADLGTVNGAGQTFVVFGTRPGPIAGDNTANTLQGGSATDTILGLGGDDLLAGRGGDDRIEGGQGQDTLIGGGGVDRLIGGLGTDFVSYATSAGAIVADFARGVFRDSTGERDRVQGIEGAIGSDFDDTLVGGAVAVTLQGGIGNDRITGGRGGGVIEGGAGNDIVTAAAGNQRVDGGEGLDRITTGTGTDTIQGGAARDVIDAGAGADRIEGGEGNDQAQGGAGNDVILGGIGNDSLSGGANADSLSGEAGNDRLEGGAGTDLLRGGLGRDVFVFRAGFELDRVLDFTDGIDRLDFSGHSGVAGIGDLTISAQGTSVLIDDGAGGHLTLAATALGEIDVSDFLF